MSEPEEVFEKLVAKYSTHKNVTKGKMMTAPALKYQGKVFTFYINETMGFKLGKDFFPADHQLEEWEYLSPFKHKPPMKAWFMVPFSQNDHWEALTELALNKMKG